VIPPPLVPSHQVKGIGDGGRAAPRRFSGMFARREEALHGDGHLVPPFGGLPFAQLPVGFDELLDDEQSILAVSVDHVAGERGDIHDDCSRVVSARLMMIARRARLALALAKINRVLVAPIPGESRAGEFP
jgi:hypothetical protein